MYTYEGVTIDGFDLCTKNLENTIDYLLSSLSPCSTFITIYNNKEDLFRFLGNDENLWSYFCYLFNQDYIRDCNIIDDIVSHKNYRVDLNLFHNTMPYGNDKFFYGKITDKSIHKIFRVSMSKINRYRCVMEFLQRKFPTDENIQNILKELDEIKIKSILYDLGNNPISDITTLEEYLKVVKYKEYSYDFNDHLDTLKKDIINFEYNKGIIRFNTYYNFKKSRVTLIYDIDIASTDLIEILNIIQNRTISKFIHKYIDNEKTIPLSLLGNDPNRWDIVYRYLNKNNVGYLKDPSILEDERLRPIKIHYTTVEILKLKYPTDKIYTLLENTDGNYKVHRILLRRLLNTTLCTNINISKKYTVEELMIVDRYGVSSALEDEFRSRGITNLYHKTLAIIATMLTVDYFFLGNIIPRELIIYYNAKKETMKKYYDMSLQHVAISYYSDN